jgi:hypothetical protein
MPLLKRFLRFKGKKFLTERTENIGLARGRVKGPRIEAGVLFGQVTKNFLVLY